MPRISSVVAACGCITLPETVAVLTGMSGQVDCGRHGWQPVIRKATVRDILHIQDPIPDPDEPPF